MNSIELRTGALDCPGYQVLRSDFRWFAENGAFCRAGEVIAYCSIMLSPVDERATIRKPFDTELFDLQIAFAPTQSGVLHRRNEVSRGGFHSLHAWVAHWSNDLVIGTLDVPGSGAAEASGGGKMQRRVFAGRRMSELAEVRSGLLTGWFSRCRAWRCDAAGPIDTLLSLGICDQSGVVRGERQAFLELMEDDVGPTQVVFWPGDCLSPCAPVLREQLLRADNERRSIADDLMRSWRDGNSRPTPMDWMFAGCFLAAIQASPISESYELLTPRGLEIAPAASAILLSALSEPPEMLRHRRLGYLAAFHAGRVDRCGPAVSDWLARDFEPIRRSLSDIQRDLRDLIDVANQHHRAKFLIQNTVATFHEENLTRYSMIDWPLGATSASVNAKEFNLMLHDLAHERDVSIIDADAIASELGVLDHCLDRVHQSGAMQGELRAEIVRALDAERVHALRNPGLN